MTHTVREKQKLLARVRRIRGQVAAVKRALVSEAGCEQVMHLLASTRAAMAGLMAEVVEDHVRTHASGRSRKASRCAERPSRRRAAGRRPTYMK